MKAIKSKWGDTYLDGQGNWVSDVAYVRKFATSAELVIFAESHGLKWFDIHEIDTGPVRAFSTEGDKPLHEPISSNGKLEA